MKRVPSLLCALALLAASCGGKPAPTPTDNLKVGVVMSTTGDAAVYGRSALAGVRYAVERLNQSGDLGDTHVELVSRDDKSTVAGAQQAFRELMAEKVNVIIGPMLSVVAAETDQIAQQAGVPVLAATNSALDITKFGDTVWRVSLSERAIIDAGVESAAERTGLTTAAIIFDPNEEYSSAAAGWFRESAKAYGITIIRQAHFTTNGRDHAEAVENAAAPGPEAFFIPSYAADALTLMREMNDQRRRQLVVGGNGFNTPSVLRAAGRTGGGLIVASSWDPRRPNALSKQFVKGYEQAIGTAPDTFAAQGYAAVEILTRAVVLGGKGSSGIEQGLREFVADETILGLVSFSDEREAEYPPFVRFVKAGSIQLFD
ncbi:MAG: ABC transporter substrate-binding protein [Actinomycetota bacterium]